MYYNKLIKSYIRQFFIASMILFVSCKKHSDYTIPTDNKRVTQIIIGDTTDMVVNKLNENALVGYRYGDSAYNLDIDGNGEKDLRFFGSRNELMGLGSWYNVKIFCISDSIRLYTYSYNDTIYISNDTTQSIQNGVMNISIVKSYLCQRKDNKDIFSSITDKSLNRLQINDTLKMNDIFENNDFEIRKTYPNYPKSYYLYFQNKDTAIYKSNIFLTGCHYFPGNDTSYIGLLLKVGANQKLGWIKISITNGRETNILETALQK